MRLKTRHKKYKREIKKALNNKTLRDALGNFAVAWKESRDEVFKGLDFEDTREKARTIKEDSLSRLSSLINEFIENAQKAGTKIFQAETGEDVNEYIYNLAKKQGAKLLVKTKSMVTEEIELNNYLEKRDIKIVETDLAEWIIQLAGQRPSHMVMPAIHLTRKEVSGLFSKYAGYEVPPDVNQLVQEARLKLREYFLKADIGISGANMAIAESGTIVLVTNEGNAELVTSLPPIHVVIVGIEKIIPKMENVVTLLKLLPRSATAQKLTSYVSFITGPTPYKDRKRELHIIIVDNKRSLMLSEPKFREALYCIKCASCLNICPTYELIGGHVFGHKYCGGIGAVWTPFIHGMDKGAEILDACMGCMSCITTCPLKIDIPDMITELKKRRGEKEGLKPSKRVIFRTILKNRKVFHSLLKTLSIGQLPVTRGKPLLRHLPLVMADQFKFRSLPALSLKPLRNRIKEVTLSEKDKKKNVTVKKVTFFAGCLIDFIYPEIGEAVLRILLDQGIDVVFPYEQGCCGIPATFSGDFKTAKEMAKYNIEVLESADSDYIITACPTCTASLKNDYLSKLEGEKGWEERAKSLSEKVYDLSPFLVRVLKIKEGDLGEKTTNPLKITYHDSCHLKREMDVWKEPRELLTRSKGHQLIEMKNADRCCGFGGSFSLEYPEMSAPILKKKIDWIKETKAEAVSLDCPGCLLQILGGLDEKIARQRFITLPSS